MTAIVHAFKHKINGTKPIDGATEEKQEASNTPQAVEKIKEFAGNAIDRIKDRMHPAETNYLLEGKVRSYGTT